MNICKSSLVVLLICISRLAGAQQFTLENAGFHANNPNEGSYGTAWGDFNNDGLPDVFITYWSTESVDTLFVNNGDGTFSRYEHGEIFEDELRSSSATWGDYNNDGFLDLFVSGVSHNNLFKNNGDNTFTKITSGAIVTDVTNSRGCAWGDYDNDGYLDLFVANQQFESLGSAPNLLYRNNGGGTFTKMNEGEIVTEFQESHLAHWIDFDNDHDLDAFVTNTFNYPYLYRNDGNGTFVKISIGEPYKSLSASWGDYNNDGLADVVIGYENAPYKVKLFKNNGDGTFTDANGSGVVSQYPVVGSGWGDYDNDGYQDLSLGVLNSNYLFRNKGDGTFEEILNEPFYNTNGGTNTSQIVWNDYNLDGKLDLFMFESIMPKLYKNTGTTANWLQISLHTEQGDPFGVGSRVTVSYRNQSQQVSTQTGMGTQAPLTLHFGLGNMTLVDVSIEWASGYCQTLTGVAANQLLSIDEATEIRCIPITGAENNLVDKISIYPNPVADYAFIDLADIPTEMCKNIFIYDAKGCNVNFSGAIKTLNMQHLPPGVYYVRIQLNRTWLTRKIVKQ